MNIPLQIFAEVIASLRQTSGGHGMEKRRSTRMNVEAPLKVTLLTEARAPRTVSGISRDISQSGVGMILGSGPTPGQRLIVHLPRTGNHPPLLVLCDVKVCTQLADGVFKVGVEFIKQLSDDELQNIKASGDEIERIQRSILSTT